MFEQLRFLPVEAALAVSAVDRPVSRTSAGSGFLLRLALHSVHEQVEEHEHARLLETSLMLLLRADLVEMDKVPDDGPAQFPPYDRWPPYLDLVPASGVLARAQGARAEKGGWLMDDHVRLMAAALRKEFSL